MNLLKRCFLSKKNPGITAYRVIMSPMKKKHDAPQTVLVTGGAKGIGYATVRLLLLEGFTVYVWDLDNSPLEELKTAYPQRLYTEQMDILNRETVEAAARDIMGKGGIDVLINNAGVLVPGDFHEQDTRHWEFMLNINLNASIFITSLFLPSMYARNSGHIINISSAAGLLGVPGLAVYSASKFAIFGFTEALRHEAKNLGKHGVRFTTVHPNFLKTGLFEGAKLAGIGNIFVPRVKNHETIAKAIVYYGMYKKRNTVKRPRSIWLALFLRTVLPDKGFQFAVRLFGVHKGMSTLSHTAGSHTTKGDRL